MLFIDICHFNNSSRNKYNWANKIRRITESSGVCKRDTEIGMKEAVKEKGEANKVTEGAEKWLEIDISKVWRYVEKGAVGVEG